MDLYIFNDAGTLCDDAGDLLPGVDAWFDLFYSWHIPFDAPRTRLPIIAVATQKLSDELRFWVENDVVWSGTVSGVLMAAMERNGVSPLKTLVVSNRPEDEQAAKSAGCAFKWADEFFGRK